MKKKNKNLATSDSSTISTLLGSDTEIEGTFTFSDTIRVDGSIKGKLISAKGTVIIGENAKIDADVQVGVAIVRGKVNGRIEAHQRIEVYSPAQVIGDISAPTITIDSGVIFNGNCQMNTASKSVSTGFKPIEKKPEKAAS